MAAAVPGRFSGVVMPGLTGCVFGMLSEAVRGPRGFPAWGELSIWVRCFATSWTAAACTRAFCRVESSSLTRFVFFVTATCFVGAIIVRLLFTTVVLLLMMVVLFTTVFC